MKYLLDTNICIYIIKKMPASVIKKFQSLKIGDMAISSITLAELEYGVAKSLHVAKNQKALSEFIFPFEIIDFDAISAKIYGEIRKNLESTGRIIGSMDLLIAAQALASKLILISNNEKEFCRVENLVVENWVEDGH